MEHTLDWPDYQKIKNKSFSSRFLPFVRFNFWIFIGKMALIIGGYLYFMVSLPDIFSFNSYQEIDLSFWWPIKAFLVLVTGGAFAEPSLVTVGLLGGIFYYKQTQRSLLRGASILSIFGVANLTFTVLAAVAVTLFYEYQLQLGVIEIVTLFLVFLVGSGLFQYLNALVLRLSGFSLYTINIILGTHYYLKYLNASEQFQFYFWLILSLVTLIISIYRLNPKYNVIEYGLPPRKLSKDAYPSADFSWLSSISLLVLFLVVISQTIWNSLVPYHSGVLELILSFAGLIFLMELIFRFNRKVGIFHEVDEFGLNRKLQTKYITIEGVEPGRPTTIFFKRLSYRAQRNVSMALYLLLVSLSSLIYFTKEMNVMAFVFAVAPIAVFLMTSGLCSMLLSIKGNYDINRASKIAKLKILQVQNLYMPQESAIALQSYEDGRLDRLIEKVSKELGIGLNDDIELELIKKELDAGGNKGGNVVRVLNLIYKIIVSRKKYNAAYESDGTMTHERAKIAVKEYLRYITVLFPLHLMVFLFISAVLVMLKVVSRESAIVLTIVSPIPLLLADLHNSKYRDAVFYMLKDYFSRVWAYISRK